MRTTGRAIRAVTAAILVGGGLAFACVDFGGLQEDSPPSPPAGDGAAADGATSGDATGSDAAFDETGAADAGADAAACDPTKPFANLAPLTSVNTASHEFRAVLSEDERTIYFDSDRLGIVQPFFATRPSTTADFDDAHPVFDAGITYIHSNPAISADGLTLVFDLRPPGDSGSDLAQSTRVDAMAPFGDRTPLDSLNGPFNDEVPWLAHDGRTLYFASNRSGDYRIYSARAEDGSYAPPDLLVLSHFDGKSDNVPVLTSAEDTIFVSSNRPGGDGSFDIWVAHRNSPSDKFSDLSNVTELNSPDFDVLTWLSPDGCRALISTTRPAPDSGGSAGGGRDIWLASRPR